MITTAFKALLSHWTRKPFQLITLILGLSLATALWSGVKAINAEADASYEQAAATLGQDQLASLIRKDSERMDQQTYVDLRRGGWQVSPLIEGQLQFGTTELRLLGVDPLTMPPQSQTLPVAKGDDLTRFLVSPSLFYVDAETAARLAGQDTPPIRILKGVPPGTIITDIGQAQILLKTGDRISRLLVWENQPAHLASLKTIAPDLVLQEPKQSSDFSRLTDSFHLNLLAFSYLAFIVGLLIVYSAVGLAFEQRRSVFRTLRALGLSLNALMLILIAELLVMALIAGVIGVALGYLIASLLLPDVTATLRGLYGVDLSGTLAFRPSWWLAGLAIAVGGTLLASVQNLWQIWNLPILGTAQAQAWAGAASKTRRWQTAGATIFLLLSLALAQFGEGLFAGFAILGTMMLGAALALPLILSWLLRGGEYLAKKPLALWFWADTRQQLSGQSIALMALLLALATNVGVGTMVSSFRLTFLGYLDQRLAAELYVSGRTEAEAEAMKTWLLPRSDAVLPIWSVDGIVEGQPAQIFGVANHDTYRKNWPLLVAMPDVWDTVARGDGILVNEQLFRREDLKLGQVIALPGGWQSTLSGVFTDYGNPVGQVIMSAEQLEAHYQGITKLRYAVRVQPKKVVTLAEDLQKQFNLPTQNLINQADLKRFSIDVFDRTFTITAALNVLTLGVAAIAMFASLMTLAEMRLPQLAPVWAMGVTKRHLAWLEFLRSLMLAAFTMIAALPLGLALGWTLLSVVNVEAFGWLIPMSVFPSEWVWLAALGFLAAAVAAALPVRRLARSSTADLLKVFSSER
jgi:putative ABC transport system permease protein